MAPTSVCGRITHAPPRERRLGLSARVLARRLLSACCDCYCLVGDCSGPAWLDAALVRLSFKLDCVSWSPGGPKPPTGWAGALGSPPPALARQPDTVASAFGSCLMSALNTTIKPAGLPANRRNSLAVHLLRALEARTLGCGGRLLQASGARAIPCGCERTVQRTGRAAHSLRCTVGFGLRAEAPTSAARPPFWPLSSGLPGGLCAMSSNCCCFFSPAGHLPPICQPPEPFASRQGHLPADWARRRPPPANNWPRLIGSLGRGRFGWPAIGGHSGGLVKRLPEETDHRSERACGWRRGP